MDDTQTYRDDNVSPGCSSVHQKSSEPVSSCVSMRSDRSMNHPVHFKGGDTQTDLSSVHQKGSEPVSSCVSMRSDRSMNHPVHFKSGDTQTDLSLHQKRSEPEPSCVSMRSEGSVAHLVHFKSGDTQTDLSHEVLNKFRSNLKKKFVCLYEGTAKQGNPTLLNEIYTELYITESESGEISNEHEVRQIETQSRRAATEDTPIKCSDIFRALPGQDKAISTVLTKGVAGIGKTVSVQKFILDWAEGKENQDVQLIFPLPFRELNLMRDKTLSLSDLLQVFFPETKEMEISSDKYKVLFIFDGLDECRLSLDFQSDVRLCDVSESASVDVLLTNLIVGSLLPSQISAAVLEKMLSQAESGEIPKTLTQMYTHYLLLQINIKHEKDYEKNVTDEDMILKLGKLAFQQLMKGNVIFYEEDLRECGIDVTEASVYSGLCTQIFREEFGLYQGKVFCFVHLSIQEHLAALYVHLSCTNHNINVFEPITIQSSLSKIKNWFQLMFKNVSLSELHQRAVNEALQSKNVHLDLFLQILLGLSLKSHQILLQGLMKQTRRNKRRNKKTVDFIKEKIRTIASSEKSINLFHCLNELGDHSLVEEIQQYLRSGTINEAKLSSSQWSAVVFVLLTSEKKQDVFNINEFVGGNDEAEKLKVLQKLLPVIKEARSVQLYCCSLTDEGCAALASALRSNPEHLRELNLSENKLGDSVNQLSAVLEDLHCKLEKLWFRESGLTGEDCAALASALRSNPSHLRQLDLSGNKLGDSVNLLAAVLEDPRCNLENLWLVDCGVTEEGFTALASAMISTPSHLRQLSLSGNKLGDSVNLLSDLLVNPDCKVETLGLMNCGLTDKGFTALASALRSNPSHLRELNLSENKLRDSVNLISAVLEDSRCKLEKLWLKKCDFTGNGCAALASALRSNPKHLRYLNLSGNKLGDFGVNQLASGLEDCEVEKLALRYCGLTNKGWDALASALKSKSSHLRHLDLSKNMLRDEGVKLLCAALKDPQCKLEILELRYCCVTDECCAPLASALESNPSHLRELHLNGNHLGPLKMRILSNFVANPIYRLEKLNH
ncbi:NACHT, LRR and PYD domains-containing protein 3-like [Sinocyclocheilus grahami]|uniref:NACHT, LRR and PYD domains-containing protein 3-like n=1 Tax=Sinocyclocheilus grahami TaxID=75366 RepID=UPI0007ACA9C2|nr:PREDICTED: NACHT, LRR and PYD domains-containing protein 3-like [Sinocyclocheilus grahami]